MYLTDSKFDVAHEILSGFSKESKYYLRSRYLLGQALLGITTAAKSGSGGAGTGTGDGNVRGSRSTQSAGIDDLVSSLGEAESSSFSRGGNFVVVSEGTLIENKGEKGIMGRNQDDVQAVVLRHNKSVQYCYERELKSNPNLKGKLVVRFTITPQGMVKDVQIASSTSNNRKVEQCVLSALRRWADFGSIPEQHGNTTVRQVYTFGY